MNPFEMERVFDVFEDAWGCPERPSIEEFLSHIDEAEKATVFKELLAIEFIKRMERGESPSCQEYEQRFAKFTAVIPEVFREVMSQVDSDQQSIGRLPKLNRFKPIDQLGRGGQGDVWLSQDPCMGRRVALKVLGSKVRENRVEFENALQLFKLESEICGKLEHPNIVPVYDISNEVTADGNLDVDAPCFVMRVFGDQRLHTAIEAFHARPRSRNEYPLLEALREFERDRTSAKRLVLEERLNQFQFDPNSDKDRELKDAIESILSGPSEAGTLSAAIKRVHSEGISDSSIRKLLGRFQRICDGIAYAHSRGVLHRDLKPANIMLGEYGETLIADWGLAKVIRRSESRAPSDLHVSPNDVVNQNAAEHELQGEVRGSLPWMSPEQANGWIDQVGIASDIYSLGAILFHILTGRAPHEGSSLSAIQQNQFAYATSINPKAPKALEAIALKAMATRPEDRYRTASELGLDIDRWLSDEAVSAWREPLVVRMKRWIRTHQTTAAAALATLTMATIAALGWGVISSRHANDLKKERDLTKLAKDEADSSRELAEERAESEKLAKEKAEAEERNATEQKIRAQRLLVDISESNAIAAMKGQDYSQALTWSVLALKQLQDTPERSDREPIMRQRIGSIMADLPYLAHLLPLDGELIHAEVAGDPGFLVTSIIRNDQLRIQKWDIATGKPSSKSIYVGVFIPNSIDIRINSLGTKIAIGYRKVSKIDGDFQCEFKVFDLDTFEQNGFTRVCSEFDKNSISQMVGGDIEKQYVIFDPTGKYLISIADRADINPKGDSEKDIIEIWDSSDIQYPIAEVEIGKDIRHLFLSDNANMVGAIYDRDQIVLKDFRSGKDLTSKAVRDMVREVQGGSGPVALSNDASLLAIPYLERIHVVDLEDANESRAVINCGDTIRTVEFADAKRDLLVTMIEGNELASTPKSGYAECWDLEDFKKIRRLGLRHEHQGLVSYFKLVSEPNVLVSGGGDGRVDARLINLNSDRFLSLHHQKKIKLASFTRDGRYFVTGSQDGLVRIWQMDHSADGESRRLGEQVNGQVLATGEQSTPSLKIEGAKPPSSHSWSDLSQYYVPLARSPQGDVLLTKNRVAVEQNSVGDASSSSQFSVQLWNIKAKDPTKRVARIPDNVDRGEFSSNGKLFALIYGKHPFWNPRLGDFVDEPQSMDAKQFGVVVVYDDKGRSLSQINIDGYIGAIEFLGDQQCLLIGYSDATFSEGIVDVFDTLTGEKICESFRLSSPVIDLKCDRAGKRIIGHHHNRTSSVMVFENSRIRESMGLPKFLGIRRTAISPNGDFVAIGCFDGRVEIFKFSDWLSSSNESNPIFRLESETSYESPIVSLRFSGQADVLLAARQDGSTMLIRNLLSTQDVDTFSSGTRIRDVVVSDDFKKMMIVGMDLGMQLFELPGFRPITTYTEGNYNGFSLESTYILPSADLRNLFCYNEKNGLSYQHFPLASQVLNELEFIASSVDPTPFFSVNDRVEGNRYSDDLKRIGFGLSQLQEYAIRNPANANLQLLLGRAFVDAGDSRRAISHLNAYCESDAGRDDHVGMKLRSRVFESLEQFDLAKNERRKSEKVYVNHMPLWASLNVIEKVTLSDPSFALELLEIVWLRYSEENRKKGVSEVEGQIIEFKSRIIEVNALAGVGEWEGAISEGEKLNQQNVFTRILENQPLLEPFLFSFLARLYLLKGNLPVFESRCESMLASLGGDYGWAYQDELANLCVDNPKAVVDLTVLLKAMDARREENRENVEFLGLLGGVEFRCGRIADSISTLSKALELVRRVPAKDLRKVTEARLMLLIALANHARGDFSEASKWKELAEPVYQAEMKGPEKVLLQLNKPTLSRLHHELHESMSTDQRLQ